MAEISIGRSELKMYLTVAINNMADEAFEQFAVIALTAIGALDEDGNVTDKYKHSHRWGDGTHEIMQHTLDSVPEELRGWLTGDDA